MTDAPPCAKVEDDAAPRFGLESEFVPRSNQPRPESIHGHSI